MKRHDALAAAVAAGVLLSTGVPAAADDWPMWGGTLSRNMVSVETGLPTEWDITDGTHVRWVAALGAMTSGNPVVAGGQVFVGTNNDHPRDPDIVEDKGILMAFRESDGAFLWQMVHDKLSAGEANDWPFQGARARMLVR